MIFKNSIKSIVRTPGKTTLFSMLIIIITAFMCLSVGIWGSSVQTLKEADERYKTIANIEYVGATYPDEIGMYDPNFAIAMKDFDYSVFENEEYVENIDRFEAFSGRIDDFVPNDKYKLDSPYANKLVLAFQMVTVYDYENAVPQGLEFCDNGYEDYVFYGLAKVINPIYTYKNAKKFDKGMVIRVFVPRVDIGDDPYHLIGNYAFTLENNCTYIANGEMNDTKSAPTFFIKPFTWGQDDRYETFYQTLAVSGYYWGHDADRNDYLPEYVRHLDTEELINKAHQSDFYFNESFEKAAKEYEEVNNSLRVYAVNDLNTVSKFEHKDYIIQEGREFTQEEYSSGKKSVIINNAVAKRLKVGIGDKITLRLRKGSEYWSMMEQSYTYGTGYLEEAEYEIVGIYKSTRIEEIDVYIPKAEWMDDTDPVISYNIANITLKNGTAEEYFALIRDKLPEAMRISVYDGGYAQLAGTLNSMRETAVLISAICALSTVAILVLFAYMFIAKQKQSVRTMRILGTTKSETRRYLLIGVLVITVISACIGFGVGIFTSDEITDMVYQNALSKGGADLRYSDLYIGSTVEPESPRFETPILIMAYVALSIIALAIIFSLISARKVLVQGREKRMTLSERMTALSRAFRQSFISIWRNGAKSFIVPMVSLVLVVFMVVFFGIQSGYLKQIDDIYKNANVMIYFTNYSGKLTTGLSIPATSINDIQESGFVSATHLMKSYKYMYKGVYKGDNETEFNVYDHELNELANPGRDEIKVITKSLVNSKLSDIMFIDSLQYNPERLNRAPLEVTYADGFDESMFLGNDNICIVPDLLMRRYELNYGDEIVLDSIKFQPSWIGRGSDIIPKGYGEYFFRIKIAGSYKSESGNMNIYAPLATGNRLFQYAAGWSSQYANYNVEWFETAEVKMKHTDEWTGEEFEYSVFVPAYSSAMFELNDNREINKFKDKLDELGYSSDLRQVRYIAINDGGLASSVNNISKHVDYMNTLSPVIYALTVIIGFVSSYLLTRTRKAELAVMRSLGSGKMKTFIMFFFEQMILCLIGSALGVIIGIIIYGTLTSMQIIAVLGYFVCYAVGCMIAVSIMNRVNVLKILSTREH